MEITRIRRDTHILGYLRKDLNHLFFSRDQFWWNGEIPEFNTEDRYSGADDARGRKLFEHDIVKVRFKSALRRNRSFRIVFRGEAFYLSDLSSNKRFRLNSPAIERLEFQSYTFLNTELVFGAGPQ